jgi:hypothetical protein
VFHTILLPARKRHSRGAVDVRERPTGHVPAPACSGPLRHIFQCLWLAPVSTQISWRMKRFQGRGHCIFPLSVAVVLDPGKTLFPFFRCWRRGFFSFGLVPWCRGGQVIALTGDFCFFTGRQNAELSSAHDSQLLGPFHHFKCRLK